MYKSPDFIKVSVNVNDVFAGYPTGGCPMDEFGNWTYTGQCEGTPDYQFVGDTFIGLGQGNACYSTQNP